MSDKCSDLDYYEPVTMVPCTGLLAVYWCGWTMAFYTELLVGVGVAKVETITRERDPPYRKVHSEVENRVVGYVFREGRFEVAEDASNFCGYCRVGEDPSEWAMDWE